MKLKIAFTLALALVFSACVNKKAPSYLTEKYGKHPWIISTGSIRSAYNLQNTYPGEPFHIARCKESIYFERAVEELALKDPSLEDQFVSPVKAKVTIEKTFISLQDQIEFQESIFENDQVKLVYAQHSFAGSGTFDSSWKNSPRISVPVEQDGIFLNDAVYTHLSFTNPGVGTRLTLRYQLEFKNLYFLNRFLFVEDFACSQKNIELFIPSWMDVTLTEHNYETSKKQRTQTFASYKHISYAGYDLPAAVKYRRGKSGFPSLFITYNTYKTGSGDVRQLMGTVDDMIRWYTPFVRNLDNATDTLKKLSSQICAGASSDEEKAKRLFYWVQDHIHYLAVENGVAGFRPDQAETVLSNRYGDCKGMANLLRCLLLSQGLEAHLVWIGTNGVDRDYSNPGLGIDNHMICRVKLQDKYHYLDATESFIGFNQHADRIQGRPCLVNLNDAYVMDTIPGATLADNSYALVADLRIEGKMLRGGFNLQLDGEDKRSFWYFRNSLAKKDRDKFTKWMAGLQFHDAEISQVDPGAGLQRDSAWLLKANVALKNRVYMDDSLLYISLQPEKAPNLTRPKSGYVGSVDLGPVGTSKQLIQLSMPDSSMLLAVPDPVITENEYYKLFFYYSRRGRQVLLEQEIEIKQSVLPEDKVGELQADCDRLIAFYNAFITLNR